MAKKNYTPEKFPIPFPTGSSLPPDQADYLKGVYDNAAANYGLRSYGEAHPFKAALSGFLSGGLPGAINARATSDAYRRQAQEKDITGFTDAYKQALANQKELDAINILGNDSQDTQAIIDKGMQLGLVNNALPSIYGQSLPGMNAEPATTQRRVHSKEFLDAYRNGAFGGSDLNYYQDAARQNVQNFRDIGQSTTPVVTTGQGDGVLRGGVNQNFDATQNVAPPFFISDPKSIMQNLQQIQSAGLAQGTEKYKFDQQAPVRNAEIIKALSEGRSADALAILRKAQTDTERQMPAKVRAETFATTERGKLERRTDPNRSSGSNNPLTGISQFQGILQNQKQAILSQMQQNGFIDKTTGLITPPSSEEASNGFFGLGAHPANTLRVNQYNALKQQLDKVDSQLTGGSVPQQIYPPKPSNSGNPAGITKHPIKGGGSVEY